GGVLEALETLLETLSVGLPAGIRFLLSATEIDKRRTFYKTISKLGAVTVCDKLDTSKAGWEEAAIELARQLAQTSGIRLEPAALELVALRTGGDRRTLTSELEKLALYVWGANRAVTAADVQLLVPLTAEAIIFELGNALASRETNHALALLQQLLQQKESPIGILLVAIIPTFRNLLAVKELMEKHRLSRPAQAFFFGKTLKKLPARSFAPQEGRKHQRLCAGHRRPARPPLPTSGTARGAKVYFGNEHRARHYPAGTGKFAATTRHPIDGKVRT
ncbi:MAG: hypothetical protein EBR81_12070, partial [Proteobacteria bacterium]|nr:hypothetical protein [Pseudomonadota bacterium]